MSDTKTPGQICYEAYHDHLVEEFGAGKIHIDMWDGWESRVKQRWEFAATAVREADAKEIADLKQGVAALKAENEGLADWIFESTYQGGI